MRLSAWDWTGDCAVCCASRAKLFQAWELATAEFTFWPCENPGKPTNAAKAATAAKPAFHWNRSAYFIRPLFSIKVLLFGIDLRQHGGTHDRYRRRCGPRCLLYTSPSP